METKDNSFVSDLKTIVGSAREYSYRAANTMQVVSNWLIGWRIVEQEQHGKQRAEYGKQIIKQASEALTAEFGKGYSVASLKSYRKFYIEFIDLQIQRAMPVEFQGTILRLEKNILLARNETSEKGQALSAFLGKNDELQKGQALSALLTWSHYERLMRVADKDARMWYMQEAASQQWDYRTLKRNIDTQYYYRLMQTPTAHKPEVEQEMVEKTAVYQQEKSAFVKNPMLIEFLGLNQDAAFTESKLEETIINHLQKFLIEMGKGYAYLKLYDTYKRPEGDNPSIGIILCSETNADVARFSTLASNPQMYAAKYLTYMPTQEELRREIEMQKELFEQKKQEEGE